MKKSILVRVAFVFITSTVVLSSCSTPAENVQDAEVNVAEANKDLEKANAVYMAEMAAYKAETTEKIAANKLIIKEFNDRVAKDKETAKAEYQMKVTELEKKNSDLKKKMDDYKSDGKENWEKFKTEFNHDMDELGKSFKDFTVKSKK